MLIIAFFTDEGVPKTGLTPTIDIWEMDGTQTINSASMTEIAGGFYKYDFTAYDESKDYAIRCDGGSGLSSDDRYVYAGNDNQILEERTTAIKDKTDAIDWTDIDFLKHIEGGRWRITNNQMIFYQSDNTTEVARFNLYDSSGQPAETNVYERTRV